MSDDLELIGLFDETEPMQNERNEFPMEVTDALPSTSTEISENETSVSTEDETSVSNNNDDKENKNSNLVDKELGIDYSYILSKNRVDTLVISDEEIAQEDTELLRTFLELNRDVKNYIDKSLFDPSAKVVKHILNLLKDKSYKITVKDKEYRLAEVIMLKAMNECYDYVCKIAEELASMGENRNCIQLDDEDVYKMAENYFRHTKSEISFTINNRKTTSENKSASKSKNVKPKKEKSNDSSCSQQISMTDFFS